MDSVPILGKQITKVKIIIWIKKKITKKDPNIARVWSSRGAKDAIEQYEKFMYLSYK